MAGRSPGGAPILDRRSPPRNPPGGPRLARPIGRPRADSISRRGAATMPSLVKPVVPRAATPQPTIRGEDFDIVLRPWRHADADQLKAAFADAEIQRWNLHKLSTTAEAEDWVERWNGRWRKRTGASWAVLGKL